MFVKIGYKPVFLFQLTGTCDVYRRRNKTREGYAAANRWNYAIKEQKL